MASRDSQGCSVGEGSPLGPVDPGAEGTSECWGDQPLEFAGQSAQEDRPARGAQGPQGPAEDPARMRPPGGGQDHLTGLEGTASETDMAGVESAPPGRLEIPRSVSTGLTEGLASVVGDSPTLMLHSSHLTNLKKQVPKRSHCPQVTEQCPRTKLKSI